MCLPLLRGAYGNYSTLLEGIGVITLTTPNNWGDIGIFTSQRLKFVGD